MFKGSGPPQNFNTGFIYNLAHILDAIDILDYRRLLAEAARISSISRLTSQSGNRHSTMAADLQA